MMISEPALVCLSGAWERVVRAAPPVASATASVGPPLSPHLAHSSEPPEVVSAAPPIAAAPPLAAHERRARAAALRGLFLARQRRFASAERAFTEALQLDPALELAKVPSFWKLERGGHEAAVRAYEAVGRVRDAAILAAEVNSTFRPRLLSTTRGPARA